MNEIKKGRGGFRPGAGAKKKIPDAHLATARIPVTDWERIPEPKAEFIREAVKEKLSKNK